MSMTDPISDMLTRLRNAMSVDKRFVDIPSSNMKKRISYVLKEEKYIEDFMFINNKVGQKIFFFRVRVCIRALGSKEDVAHILPSDITLK